MMFCRIVFAAFLAVAVSAQTDTAGGALFSAVQRGATAEVDRLLAHGASANAADAEGTPILMAAVLFADAPTVKILLDHGADVNRADASGATALMWAVPDLDKVRLLVTRGADVNARSESQRTPLLVAASYPGTVEVLRLLLDRGADLRAKDRAGTTALALAVRSADVQVVRFLADSGLDPRSLTAAERRIAVARWDRPTTDYLLSNAPTPVTDLLGAAATWQPPELVARWIDLGADVNASAAAQYGRTPLMNAVASEAEGAATVKLLLDRGADPNVRMSEGETPLDWAIYKGDRAKIEALEQHGAVRGNGPRREAIAAPAAGAIADPRVSLGKSAAQLLAAASTFREKTNCISCHHNGLPAMVAAAVRRKGIAVDDRLDQRNLDDMLTFFKRNAARVMLGDPAVGGEALTVGYTQLGLAAARHPSDKLTAMMTHWVLARQMPDGSWLGNGLNRPPLEYSIISHTAMAAGGLVSYPLPGLRKSIQESLRKARQWLLASQPKSAEERGMRLMGLVWTDAPRARIQAAVADVRAQQDAAGGWAQFARTDADAYATGLSLFALHTAGVPATDPAYRKGVAFLLGTQYPDGTWLVKSHSFPVQRYFESGFPFGRHQWISAAGTSWAALAIAETLPDAPVTH